MSANLMFAAFILAIALVVACLTWWSFRVDRSNRALSAGSGTWPSVKGIMNAVDLHVTRASGEDDADTFQPRVAYSYSVDGKELAGTRIDFTRLHFVSEAKARARIASYSVGAPVQVAYNPADPAVSVLDRTRQPPNVSFWTVFALVLTLILIGIGLFLALSP